MAVQVTNVGTVIGLAVLGARARGPLVTATGFQGDAVKSVDRLARRGKESHMGTVADSGRFSVIGPADPKPGAIVFSSGEGDKSLLSTIQCNPRGRSTAS
jgi:hypothetical protein